MVYTKGMRDEKRGENIRSEGEEINEQRFTIDIMTVRFGGCQKTINYKTISVRCRYYVCISPSYYDLEKTIVFPHQIFYVKLQS